VKPHRSKNFISWLRDNFKICQRCGAQATDFAHPPKRRPWGGGISQKASDLGGIRLCRSCHDDDNAASWGTERFLNRRNIISLSNLAQYMEYLDPGCDLFADIMQYAQELVHQTEKLVGAND